MCLSIAYKNSIDPNNILMKNVASIETIADKVILIDLMERRLSVPGTLAMANLTDGYLVINTKE